ncbi:hypothetical protein Q7C36_007519 [Tachysurus vachellii]|uniref:Uncharacterized protein n=1 Tax=Tachysurus vachellii TaxID=175792 RepID=A0AA88N5L6_TACVA|nr:hypothetical protein Q7C36_007519 [Tachysurus vachellii]
MGGKIPAAKQRTATHSSPSKGEQFSRTGCRAPKQIAPLGRRMTRADGFGLLLTACLWDTPFSFCFTEGRSHLVSCTIPPTG